MFGFTEQQYAAILRFKAQLDKLAETLDELSTTTPDGVERQGLERAAKHAEAASFALIDFT